MEKKERVITLTGNPITDLVILQHEELRIRREKIEDDYKKLNEAFEKYKKRVKDHRAQ